MRLVMLRTTIIVLFSFFVAACGTAPAPTRSNVQPFSVISEQADPVASNLTLLVRSGY